MQNNIKNKTNLRSFKMKNRNIVTDPSINTRFTTKNTDDNTSKTPLDRIKKLIYALDDVLSITEDTPLTEFLYDSIARIEFLVALEKEFSITISEEEIYNTAKVGDVHTLITSKIRQQ